jgi:DNA polymerase III delta prime subunit
MKELILEEKYRPKTVDEIILPERITNHFKNGLTKNCIFYGSYGTGKTSLANILIGKYTKDKNYLQINSSLYTSVEVLRNEVELFCKSSSMLDTDDDMKYVFLDEFEGVSAKYQEGMKAFIEHYSGRVRFILTTNHFNKISKGIRSRLTSINFNCTPDEEVDMKKRSLARIKEIAQLENIDIPENELVDIVKKNFPDIRSMVKQLQNFVDTGSVKSNLSVDNTLKLNLYRSLFKKDMTYDDIYHFLMDNFGDENIDIVMELLSRPFVEFMMEKNQSVDKLFKCNYVVSQYHPQLESQADPVILGMTVIGKLRDILIS